MTQVKLIKDRDIFFNVEATSKAELFDFVGSMAVKLGIANDANAIACDLMDRENELTTGLTDGFAIPHTKSENVNEVGVLFIRTKEPIHWETMDDIDPTCFFVLLVPKESRGNIHLRMISTLAASLLEDDFKERVKSSADTEVLTTYLSESITM